MNCNIKDRIIEEFAGMGYLIPQSASYWGSYEVTPGNVGINIPFTEELNKVEESLNKVGIKLKSPLFEFKKEGTTVIAIPNKAAFVKLERDIKTGVKVGSNISNLSQKELVTKKGSKYSYNPYLIKLAFNKSLKEEFNQLPVGLITSSEDFTDYIIQLEKTKEKVTKEDFIKGAYHSTEESYISFLNEKTFKSLGKLSEYANTMNLVVDNQHTVEMEETWGEPMFSVVPNDLNLNESVDGTIPKTGIKNLLEQISSQKERIENSLRAISVQITELSKQGLFEQVKEKRKEYNEQKEKLKGIKDKKIGVDMDIQFLEESLVAEDDYITYAEKDAAGNPASKVINTDASKALKYFGDKDLNKAIDLVKRAKEGLTVTAELKNARYILDFWVKSGLEANPVNNSFYSKEQVAEIQKNALEEAELEKNTTNGEFVSRNNRNIVKTLRNLSSQAIRLDSEINEIEKSNIVELVNSRSSVKGTYKGEKLSVEEILRERGGLKDITLFDMLVMDMQHQVFSTNGIIPQIMYDLLQEKVAIKKSSAAAFQLELDKVLVDATETMKSLGGYTLKGFLPGVTVINWGKLFRDIDENSTTGSALLSDGITRKIKASYSKKYFENTKEIKELENNAYHKKKGSLDRALLEQEARKQNYEFHKENTEVIDFRKLHGFSEILEKYPDVYGLEDNYSEEEKDAYEQELKDLTKSTSGRFLKKELEKQKEKLIQYAIEEMLQKEKLEAGQIKQEDFDTFRKENNPAIILEDYNKEHPLDTGNLKASRFKYNMSLPLAAENYNTGNFSVIEENESLWDFYNLLEDLSKKYYDSLTSAESKFSKPFSIPGFKKTASDILAKPDATAFEKLSDFFRFVLESLKTMFREGIQNSFSEAKNDPITGLPKYTINSDYQASINDQLFKMLDPYYTRLAVILDINRKDETFREKVRDEFINLTQDSVVTRDLINLMNEVSPTNILTLQDVKARFPKMDLEDFDVVEAMKKLITNNIVAEETMDLPKMMRVYSNTIAVYQARQEVVSEVELLKNHYQKIKNTVTTKTGEAIKNYKGTKGEDGKDDTEARLEGLRERANKQAESQFQRTVLGRYDSKNELQTGKIQEAIMGVLGNANKEGKPEKIDAATGKVKFKGKSLLRFNMFKPHLNESETQYKELLEKTIKSLDPVEDADEISELKGKQDSLGQAFTITSIFDGLFKFIRLKSLGWNLNSGLTNLMEGQISNTLAAASGIYFTPESFYKANQIASQSLLRGVNKRLSTAEAMKLSILMERMDALQDATNELQKADKKSRYSKYSSKASPYELTKRVEYLNQSPILIATLLDTKITGKNGEVSSVWEAFDKNAELKPEFATPQNIYNWNALTSSEKNGLKRDNPELNLNEEQYTEASRHIRESIVKIHGDYDELRGNMASEYMSGKAIMMFKRWMGSMIFSRFAAEQDLIALKQKGFKGRYRSHTAATGGMTLGLAGTLLAGPLGGMIGLGIGTIAGKTLNVNSNAGYLRETAMVAKNALLNIVGIPVNSIVGKSLIKLNDVKDLKINGEADGIDVKNFKTNMTEISLLLGLILLQLIVKGLTWDDDDDENSPRRMAHNLLINKIMTLSNQSTMYLSPKGMWDSVSSVAAIRFLDDVSKTAVAAHTALNGKDTILKGRHRGESKLAKQFTRTFIPGGGLKGLVNGDIGFDGQMEQVFPGNESFSKTYFESEETKQKRAEKSQKSKDFKDWKDLKGNEDKNADDFNKVYGKTSEEIKEAEMKSYINKKRAEFKGSIPGFSAKKYKEDANYKKKINKVMKKKFPTVRKESTENKYKRYQRIR